MQIGSPNSDGLCPITIQSVEAIGTPITIAGIYSGQIQVSSDPNNGGSGFLNISTGEINFTENLFLTSPYLASIGIDPIAIQLISKGVMTPVYMSATTLTSFRTHGIGRIGDNIPILGGATVFACNTQTSQYSQGGVQDYVTCWKYWWPKVHGIFDSKPPAPFGLYTLFATGRSWRMVFNGQWEIGGCFFSNGDNDYYATEEGFCWINREGKVDDDHDGFEDSFKFFYNASTNTLVIRHYEGTTCVSVRYLSPPTFESGKNGRGGLTPIIDEMKDEGNEPGNDPEPPPDSPDASTNSRTSSLYFSMDTETSIAPWYMTDHHGCVCYMRCRVDCVNSDQNNWYYSLYLPPIGEPLVIHVGDSIVITCYDVTSAQVSGDAKNDVNGAWVVAEVAPSFVRFLATKNALLSNSLEGFSLYSPDSLTGLVRWDTYFQESMLNCHMLGPIGRKH